MIRKLLERHSGAKNISVYIPPYFAAYVIEPQIRSLLVWRHRQYRERERGAERDRERERGNIGRKLAPVLLDLSRRICYRQAEEGRALF